MENKQIDQTFEIKSLLEDGTFEGLAAAYGNTDSQGDVIQPGAFAAAEGQTIPLLFAHKTDQPIGTATVVETPRGLLLKGKLLLDTIAGREAYVRLKVGVLKALSVGFQLPPGGFTMKGAIRHITTAILKEVSLVVFGANERALVTAVKEDTPACACTCESCVSGDCSGCDATECVAENCGCGAEPVAKAAQATHGCNFGALREFL